MNPKLSNRFKMKTSVVVWSELKCKRDENLTYVSNVLNKNRQNAAMDEWQNTLCKRLTKNIMSGWITCFSFHIPSYVDSHMKTFPFFLFPETDSWKIKFQVCGS